MNIPDIQISSDKTGFALLQRHSTKNTLVLITPKNAHEVLAKLKAYVDSIDSEITK